MLVYKILRAPEFAVFVAAGRSDGAPVDLADGFIHASTGVQLAQTAAKHFAGAVDLWLLALDADALGPALRWEVSRGGAEFPHLYRAMQAADVVWARLIASGAYGHDLGPLP